jgi:hypothetical protein
MDDLYIIGCIVFFAYTFGLVVGTILGIELMRNHKQNRRPADA